MRIIIFFVIIGLLQACAHSPKPQARPGAYYLDDGPHTRAHVDPATVANATPRTEALSPRGNKPYTVFGKRYHPLPHARGYHARGTASWYGKKFHGNTTSNGETYDMYAMSAAHKTLPLPSYVRVTNLSNSRSVVVRVNDRGPFLHNRLIDLSYAAAAKLDMLRTGTAQVEVTAINSDTTRASAHRTTTTTDVSAQTNAPNLSTRQQLGNDAGRLYLQVGAFSQQANAQRLLARLQPQIDAPINVLTLKQSRGAVYRVRIGPLRSVEHSGDLAERVQQLGITDVIIVSE